MRVLAGGIADAPGEVADQEDDLVAEVLELAHLGQQHTVAKVQIGSRRIETGLDTQLAAGLELLDQLVLQQDLLGASFQQRQRACDVGHRLPLHELR